MKKRLTPAAHRRIHLTQLPREAWQSVSHEHGIICAGRFPKRTRAQPSSTTRQFLSILIFTRTC